MTERLVSEIQDIIETNKRLTQENIELGMTEEALLKDLKYCKREVESHKQIAEQIRKDRDRLVEIVAETRQHLVNTPDYSAFIDFPTLVKKVVERFETQRKTISQYHEDATKIKSHLEAWGGYHKGETLESAVKRLVGAVKGRKSDCCEITNDAHGDEVRHLNGVIDGLKNELKMVKGQRDQEVKTRQQCQTALDLEQKKVRKIARMIPGDEASVVDTVANLQGENHLLKRSLEELLQGYEKAMDIHNKLYPSRPEHQEIMNRLEAVVDDERYSCEMRKLAKDALNWIK